MIEVQRYDSQFFCQNLWMSTDLDVFGYFQGNSLRKPGSCVDFSNISYVHLFHCTVVEKEAAAMRQ